MSTERLAATGRNILARSRRMLLPPHAPALPHAYISLLLDPATLIDAAWGARLSAPSTLAPRATVESFETSEMREPRFAKSSFDLPAPRSQTPPPSTSDYAAHASPRRDDFAHASSAERDAFPLRPVQPPRVGTRPASWRAPIELPIASRARSMQRESAASSTSDESSTATRASLKPFATRAMLDDDAPQSFPGVTSPKPAPRTRFDQPTPAASTTPTTARPFAAPPPSHGASEPTWTDSPAAFSSGQSSDTRERTSLMRPQSLPSSARPMLMRPSASSPRDAQGNPASDDRREREANMRDARAGALRREVAAESHASASQEPESRLRFAQTPSRLAALLNANLDAQAPTPDAPPSHVHELPSGGMAVLPVPAVRSLAPHGASNERAANDERAASRGEGEELSVEGVIEELYERLRLEFLRTYGTSGE